MDLHLVIAGDLSAISYPSDESCDGFLQIPPKAAARLSESKLQVA